MKAHRITDFPVFKENLLPFLLSSVDFTCFSLIIIFCCFTAEFQTFNEDTQHHKPKSDNKNPNQIQ